MRYNRIKTNPKRGVPEEGQSSQERIGGQEADDHWKTDSLDDG